MIQLFSDQGTDLGYTTDLLHAILASREHLNTTPQSSYVEFHAPDGSIFMTLNRNEETGHADLFVQLD